MKDLLASKKIWVSLLVIGVVFFGGFKFHDNHKLKSLSLTTLGGNDKLIEGGAEIKISILGNSYKDDKFIIIRQISPKNPTANMPFNGVTSWSSNSQLLGLKSSFKCITHHPEDPKVSGVWIDGEKQEIENRVRIFYISDTIKAFEVPYKDEDEADLLSDARSMNPFEFVDKRIKPHFP